MIDLSQRVAIVTGASSGLGIAIARALAGAGAKTVLAARTAAKLKTLAEEIRAAGGTALDCATDLTSEEQVLRLFKTTMDAYGRVDLVVNNAGIADHTPTAELSLAQWQKVLDINLTAAFLCSREAMKIMKTQKRGRIINIGSVSYRVPRPHTAAYAATKCALDGLTRSMALDGREDGITVSILHPGVADSMLAGPQPKRPARLMMQASEIGSVVLTMASLPDETNMLEAMMLPIGMPFLGRG